MTEITQDMKFRLEFFLCRTIWRYESNDPLENESAIYLSPPQPLVPGEKAQIDVKIVPKSCIPGKAKDEGLCLYQYTAMDECTRFRYLDAFGEHSTYASKEFLEELIRVFPFPIKKKFRRI